MHPFYYSAYFNVTGGPAVNNLLTELNMSYLKHTNLSEAARSLSDAAVLDGRMH